MAEPDEPDESGGSDGPAAGADRLAYSRLRQGAPAARPQVGPAPFTPADLRAALARAFPGDAAFRDSVYTDRLPDFGRTDVLWNADDALLVALLSPAPAERVRAHLSRASEALAAALARVRAEYPQ